MSEIPDIQRQYLASLAREGRRFDGRAFDEYRPMSIETGLIKQADGSARVHLGDTQVYAGIKFILGTPYPDQPNKGSMITTAELNPMANPEFESGPPRERAIEIGRVIDRGIREGGVLDMEKLCIEEGEKVWVAFLDLHVVDFDGNLFDAGTLALLAALMTGNIPWNKLDDGRDPEPIDVGSIPVMTTAVKIGSELMWDPTQLEEKVARPRMSISTDENGHVRAGQKGESGGFTPEEVKTVIKESRIRSDEIRAILMDHVKGQGN